MIYIFLYWITGYNTELADLVYGFSLYVLFFHFRSPDVSKGIFLLFFHKLCIHNKNLYF